MVSLCKILLAAVGTWQKHSELSHLSGVAPNCHPVLKSFGKVFRSPATSSNCTYIARSVSMATGNWWYRHTYVTCQCIATKLAILQADWVVMLRPLCHRNLVHMYRLFLCLWIHNGLVCESSGHLIYTSLSFTHGVTSTILFLVHG